MLTHQPTWNEGEELSCDKLNRLRDSVEQLSVYPVTSRRRTIYPFKIMRKPRPKTAEDRRTIRVHIGTVNGSVPLFTDSVVQGGSLTDTEGKAISYIKGPVDMVIPEDADDYAIFVACQLVDACGDSSSGRGQTPCGSPHAWDTRKDNSQNILMRTAFIAHGENKDISLKGFTGPYQPAAFRYNDGTPEQAVTAPMDIAQSSMWFYPPPLGSGKPWQPIPTAAQQDFQRFTYDLIDRYPTELGVLPIFEDWSQYDDDATAIPGGYGYFATGVGNGFARCLIGRVSTKGGRVKILEQRVKDNLTLTLTGRYMDYRQIGYNTNRAVCITRPQFFSPDNNPPMRTSNDTTCGRCLADDYTQDDSWCVAPVGPLFPTTIYSEHICCRVVIPIDGNGHPINESICYEKRSANEIQNRLQALGYDATAINYWLNNCNDPNGGDRECGQHSVSFGIDLPPIYDEC